ncbi:MAG TPA: hypothetical protein VLJ86_07280 [Ramlibacter sp.]|nr:hypothetical protein [Ramlibacter sp.]
MNEMIAQGKRPAELARRMNARPQEVTRLIDLHHPTEIDTIAAALTGTRQAPGYASRVIPRLRTGDKATLARRTFLMLQSL